MPSLYVTVLIANCTASLLAPTTMISLYFGISSKAVISALPKPLKYAGPLQFFETFDKVRGAY